MAIQVIIDQVCVLYGFFIELGIFSKYNEHIVFFCLHGKQ